MKAKAQIQRDYKAECAAWRRDFTKEQKHRARVEAGLNQEIARLKVQVLLLERALVPFLLFRPDGDIGWRGRKRALCGEVLVSDILRIERLLGRKRVDELIEKAREARKGGAE